MRRMMLAIAAGTMLYAAPALAQPVGNFQVEGRIGDQTYRGTAEVTPQGDTFAISWRIDGNVYEGIGLWRDQQFIVGYRAGPDTGVAIYRQTAPGVWTGEWAPIGSRVVGTETITAAGGGTAK